MKEDSGVSHHDLTVTLLDATLAPARAFRVLGAGRRSRYAGLTADHVPARREIVFRNDLVDGDVNAVLRRHQ
jgi:hypothetical protein